MSEYELGKDMQRVVSMLESLTARVEQLEGKKGPCKGCRGSDSVQISDTGAREVESRDGKRVTARYKTFTWGEARTGNCDYVSESVTIYDDGTIEDVASIHCDSGVLFACYFETGMDYKDSSGHVYTTTGWSSNLAGTNSTDIRRREWRAAVRDAFDSINLMTRHRHCEW